MDTDNPYSSSESAPEPNSQLRSSKIKRFALGACIGFAPPGFLGGYGLYQFNAYVASAPPGDFICGNGAIGPTLLIIFVAPLTALVGGVIALAR